MPKLILRGLAIALFALACPQLAAAGPANGSNAELARLDKYFGSWDAQLKQGGLRPYSEGIGGDLKAYNFFGAHLGGSLQRTIDSRGYARPALSVRAGFVGGLGSGVIYRAGLEHSEELKSGAKHPLASVHSRISADFAAGPGASIALGARSNNRLAAGLYGAYGLAYGLVGEVGGEVEIPLFKRATKLRKGVTEALGLLQSAHQARARGDEASLRSSLVQLRKLRQSTKQQYQKARRAARFLQR